MLDSDIKAKDAQNFFPIGQEIGIKQPFLKMDKGNTGDPFLRNDNISNIIFKIKETDPLKLKEDGNKFFKLKDYRRAILYYSEAV